MALHLSDIKKRRREIYMTKILYITFIDKVVELQVQLNLTLTNCTSVWLYKFDDHHPRSTQLTFLSSLQAPYGLTWACEDIF